MERRSERGPSGWLFCWEYLSNLIWQNSEKPVSGTSAEAGSGCCSPRLLPSSFSLAFIEGLSTRKNLGSFTWLRFLPLVWDGRRCLVQPLRQSAVTRIFYSAT